MALGASTFYQRTAQCAETWIQDSTRSSANRTVSVSVSSPCSPSAAASIAVRSTEDSEDSSMVRWRTFENAEKPVRLDTRPNRTETSNRKT